MVVSNQSKINSATSSLDKGKFIMHICKEEIYRKIFHLFALLIPVLILVAPLNGYSYWLIPKLLMGLLLVAVTIEYSRLNVDFVRMFFDKTFGVLLRNHEKSGLSGSTWLVASSLFISILFV